MSEKPSRKFNATAVARPRSRCGFSLVEMVMVLAVIAILVAIFTPMVAPKRQAGYDAAAQATGRNAQNSMEIFGQIGRDYPRDLEALLEFQPNLANHPEITFKFGRCNSWGYTFTTQHHLSENTFAYQADYSRH